MHAYRARHRACPILLFALFVRSCSRVNAYQLFRTSAFRPDSAPLLIPPLHVHEFPLVRHCVVFIPGPAQFATSPVLHLLGHRSILLFQSRTDAT
ncbi:uncharacterized protein EDB91DRAFT_10357 [Suillus paluster]|uniref:uncharacterized protein n=1 Tax=Suillus paluster TaxID=48578 RepID=UPI001B883B74|nr:uncharacterized protein EDB91DRAFT_10357 [Suillus paluster]KAG1756357.1 hypothetical protein EDB91DRAFT_10357 [Suillus paluster]